ncbi:sugar phosphate isomerase/epimerase family protein [Aeromicrobium sp. UC242_57]|uniref:sugar phosphate isomerase/epimerase family protein n=1 Tax=Aeromicrobium sp. UC242_57 TaxID=3374624 RepID=UPI0037B5BF42
MFTLDTPNRWAEERSSLSRTVEAAAAMGSHLVYGTAGPAGQLTFEAATEALAEASAPVLEHGRTLGVDILIETTNQLRQELNFVYNLRDLKTVSDSTGIGICADMFHCWREARLDQIITEIAPATRMVQLSDWTPGITSMPDRVVPGDGQVPFARILDQFERSGFTGIYDIELLGPRLNAEGLGAFRRAGEHLTEILTSLEATTP